MFSTFNEYLDEGLIPILITLRFILQNYNYFKVMKINRNVKEWTNVKRDNGTRLDGVIVRRLNVEKKTV